MKGISHLISAVILLAIAISLASIYAEWAPNFSRNVTGEVVDTTNNRIKCSNAGFDLKNARYDITGKEARVEIENTGTIRLSDDIIIGTIKNSLNTGQTTVDNLEVGETQTVTVTTEKIPDTVLASSQTCPELKSEETDIDVSR